MLWFLPPLQSEFLKVAKSGKTVTKHIIIDTAQSGRAHRGTFCLRQKQDRYTPRERVWESSLMWCSPRGDSNHLFRAVPLSLVYLWPITSFSFLHLTCFRVLPNMYVHLFAKMASVQRLWEADTTYYGMLSPPFMMPMYSQRDLLDLKYEKHVVS